MKNVSFIFSGSRKKTYEEIKKGESSDTQLYGMNHLSSNFTVDSREFSDSRFGKVLQKVFGRLIDFRMRHFLSFFMVRKSDIVFGASLLYMIPLKKIFGAQGKFILFNISLNRLLNENSKSIFYGLILWLLKEIDLIVSLSHVQNTALEKTHYISKDKLAFVPLGVDTAFYKPVFTGRSDFILAAGRDNGRDYKTVIEVARRMPEQEFHLVLSPRNLEGIADIPENVKIFYDIPKKEMNKKYAEAAVLLLITHQDNFSDGSDCSGQTVLLESFATGIPVIASRKAYITDYARDKQHLLLVDFYDSSAIIEAMKVIKTSGEAMARAARAHVEQGFSTTSMGTKLSEVFNSLNL